MDDAALILLLLFCVLLVCVCVGGGGSGFLLFVIFVLFGWVCFVCFGLSFWGVGWGVLRGGGEESWLGGGEGVQGVDGEGV